MVHIIDAYKMQTQTRTHTHSVTRASLFHSHNKHVNVLRYTGFNCGNVCSPYNDTPLNRRTHAHNAHKYVQVEQSTMAITTATRTTKQIYRNLFYVMMPITTNSHIKISTAFLLVFSSYSFRRNKTETTFSYHTGVTLMPTMAHGAGKIAAYHFDRYDPKNIFEITR